MHGTEPGDIKILAMDAIEELRDAARRKRSARIGAVVLGFPFTMVSAGIAGTNLPKPIGPSIAMAICMVGLIWLCVMTVMAFVAAAQERRINKQWDMLAETMDFEADAALPHKGVFGDHRFVRLEDGGIAATHVRGIVCTSVLRVMIAMLGLFMLYVAWRVVVWHGFPRGAQPWQSGDYKALACVIALAAVGPLIVVGAFRPFTVGWKLRPSTDSFEIIRSRWIFGSRVRSFGLDEIEGFEATGGGVRVGLVSGDAYTLIEPGDLAIDGRAARLGAHSNRIARHSLVTEWQARRMVVALRAIAGFEAASEPDPLGRRHRNESDAASR